MTSSIPNIPVGVAAPPTATGQRASIDRVLGREVNETAAAATVAPKKVAVAVADDLTAAAVAVVAVIGAAAFLNWWASENPAVINKAAEEISGKLNELRSALQKLGVDIGVPSTKQIVGFLERQFRQLKNSLVSAGQNIWNAPGAVRDAFNTVADAIIQSMFSNKPPRNGKPDRTDYTPDLNDLSKPPRRKGQSDADNMRIHRESNNGQMQDLRRSSNSLPQSQTGVRPAVSNAQRFSGKLETG
jgi:hypothetical protein